LFLCTLTLVLIYTSPLPLGRSSSVLCLDVKDASVPIAGGGCTFEVGGGNSEQWVCACSSDSGAVCCLLSSAVMSDGPSLLFHHHPSLLFLLFHHHRTPSLPKDTTFPLSVLYSLYVSLSYSPLCSAHDSVLLLVILTHGVLSSSIFTYHPVALPAHTIITHLSPPCCWDRYGHCLHVSHLS
jgi:hypothetical protein